MLYGFGMSFMDMSGGRIIMIIIPQGLGSLISMDNGGI
jgi:hypothetical protein